MAEIFFSIDIETDGPIPGQNSMLSIGCAAFSEDEIIIDSFYVNIEPLPDAVQDPNTMNWWRLPHNRLAYLATQKDQQDPTAAMTRFNGWVNEVATSNRGKPVCVAYPSGFDFTWVYWYLMRFNGSSPFSFGCLDIKSYAMAKLGTEFRQTTKRNMPKEWFEGLPKHTHHALDDAIEQGMLFLRIRNHGKVV